MMKKNTYMRAYEACGTFFSETGQMPTIDTIKPIVGVNSPSTISSAIKDWKIALSQTIRKDQGVNPGIPAFLVDAVTELWEQALAEVKCALNDKVDELQAKQTALETRETALNEEKSHIQQLVHISGQKFQEEINCLKKDLERLTVESISLSEQAENYRVIATEVEKKNAVLTEEIRQEKDKLLRLENQYDKEHDWALKRIEEEKDSHRQQTQSEMNRLQYEAARSKQSAELLQAKVDMLSNQANEDRNKIIELERSLADEKLKLAGLALNEAKLQNEIYDKEERLNKAHKKAR